MGFGRSIFDRIEKHIMARTEPYKITFWELKQLWNYCKFLQQRLDDVERELHEIKVKNIGRTDY